MNELPIKFRQGREEDIPFIISTWLKGLYYGNPWFNEIKKDNFMRKYHKILTQLLAKEGIKANVAVMANDPDHLLGYAILEGNTLHWVFVKKAFRKVGIGRALVPQTIDTTTHLTITGRKLKPQHIEFDPFRL